MNKAIRQQSGDTSRTETNPPTGVGKSHRFVGRRGGKAGIARPPATPGISAGSKRNQSSVPRKARLPSQRELVAFHCRETVIHELGHAVVARPWSDQVTVRIYPTPNPVGAPLCRTVIGDTTSGPTASDWNSAVLGWAGRLAEILDEEWNVDRWALFDILETAFHELSPTDRQSIERVPRSWRDRTILRARNILQANWPEITRVAASLVDEYMRKGWASAEWTTSRGWEII